MHFILPVAFFIYAVSAHHQHRSHHRFLSKIESAESKFDRVLVSDNKTGISYNPYSRQHPGRHVCATHKNVTIPLATKESFCKPVYKKYFHKCKNGQLCTGVKLVYETSYRDLVTTQVKTQTVFACCPGWTRMHNRSVGCHRPICSAKCHNGGFCARPNICSCSNGFAGRNCEVDVNECMENKPCDQICHNTFGSFKCECRKAFVLQADGQSCKKEGGDDTAFEAKDLENELLDKQFKLDMLLEKNKNHETKIKKMENKIDNISQDLDMLRHKIKEVEAFKNEVIYLKNMVNHLDKAISKKEKIGPRKLPKPEDKIY